MALPPLPALLLLAVLPPAADAGARASGGGTLGSLASSRSSIHVRGRSSTVGIPGDIPRRRFRVSAMTSPALKQPGVAPLVGTISDGSRRGAGGRPGRRHLRRSRRGLSANVGLEDAAGKFASNSAGWLLISLAVAFHEGGHFYTALSQSMRIKEYAIGFGPKVLSRKGGERNITYSLRALPFGGFVSFPSVRGAEEDEREEEESNAKGELSSKDRSGDEEDDDMKFESDDPDLLENRPIPQQVLVALGGILANLMIGYFACIGAALGGIPDPILADGIVIQGVDPTGSASKAGLEKDDVVLRVGDIRIPAQDGVKAFVNEIGSKPDETIELSIRKHGEGEPITKAVTPNKDGRIMVQVKPNVAEMNRKTANNVGGVLDLASSEYNRLLYDIVDGYSSVVKGSSKAEFAGPLSMAQMGSNTVSTGDVAETFLFFAALNLNLAAANALPIPGLDGARVVSLLALALYGKREIPEKAQQTIEIVTEISGLLLVILVANVLFADIGRVVPSLPALLKN